MITTQKPIQESLAEFNPSGFCLEFTLQHWCLWQSVDTVLQATWPNGELLPYNEGRADVSFLPMMQSRRLSPLARAVSSVAWSCQQKYPDIPSIFLSIHGESHYYFEILENLAKHEEVSPSRFSLCVHNAIAGLSSIHHKSSSPYLSLAGGNEGLFAAFLEASGLLLETPKVLLVFYGQALPEAYRVYLNTPETTWALAMVVARKEATGQLLQLTRNSYHHEGIAEDSGQALVQSILKGQRRSSCYLERSVWQWSLCDD